MQASREAAKEPEDGWGSFDEVPLSPLSKPALPQRLLTRQALHCASA